MTPCRRVLLSLGSILLVAPLLAVSSGATSSAAPAARSAENHTKAAQAAVAWQRIAIRTVFTEAGLSPPAGSLYLSFTSLAVYDAAREGQEHGRVAATAAVATAAHDVLHEYFPASRTALDADLTAVMATIPDDSTADAGAAIGAAAADEMIASRVGDGRNDASIVYSKTAAVGIWPATGPGGMAVPWLGFVDPVVDVAPVAVDGPDALTGPAYAADYNEVRLLGSTTSTDRTAEQTAIARFFATNPVLGYRGALCRYLEAEPLGLLPVTRMFARIDAASANSFIQTWRLKFDVGYWRPFQAILGAETDGNPATGLHPTAWVPLVTNPAYSEYTSGHAAATSPFAEVVRQTLGDDVPLVLRSGGLERCYATLTALEHDALNARIWGGLHFRDAMDDGYLMGHTTAERVMHAIR
jgi:hypothetical protein